MQKAPESGIRIPPGELEAFVTDLYQAAGTTRQHAEVLARLLVRTDLRGIISHGTNMAPEYLRLMREGDVNPRPDITIVNETTTTRVLDGDGGMGHWPCYEGTLWAIERAKEHGTAAVTTRNHHHFGAASNYTVMALEQDCIGFAVSTHRWKAEQGSIFQLISNSPLSFGIPAGDQPPVVPDQGMNLVGFDPESFAANSRVFYKALGLATIPHIFGGLMAGIWNPECLPPTSQWDSNQGGFIAVYNLAAFMPVDQFKEIMDGYIERARNLDPAPGDDQAELPGGLEHARQSNYRENGIPLGDELIERMNSEAEILGLETPFRRFEHTRFGTPEGS
jgi:LDH2 family malate/lactate/ureidoglycolate dehydrogenase